MECPHAYLKQNIDYVLCKKEPEPTRFDREKLFHAVCGHQVDCPRENCHKLSANWRKCLKLVERKETLSEAISAEPIQEPTEPAEKPKRTRRKAKEEPAAEE